MFVTYYLLELALVTAAASTVALAVEQLIVLLDELDLLERGPRQRGTHVPDPEPRVFLRERGHGNLTARGCAWIKRVASPGI